VCLWVTNSHCFEGLCHCLQWQSSCTYCPWTWNWHDAKNPTLQHSVISLMSEVLSITLAVAVFVKITVLDSDLLTITHFHSSESEYDHVAGMSVFCYSSATAHIILRSVNQSISKWGWLISWSMEWDSLLQLLNIFCSSRKSFHFIKTIRPCFSHFLSLFSIVPLMFRTFL